MNDLKAGSVIKPGDVRRIRPGFGISPKFYNDIIGKVTVTDIKRGQPVNWDMIKEA